MTSNSAPTLPPSMKNKAKAIAPSSTQPSPSSFLNLPLEIRALVYSFLDFNAKYTPPQRAVTNEDGSTAQPPPPTPATVRNDAHVLRICRFIYNEAQPLIYSHSSLEIALGASPQMCHWPGGPSKIAETRTMRFFDTMPYAWKKNIAIFRLSGRHSRSFRNLSRHVFQEFAALKRVEVEVDMRYHEVRCVTDMPGRQMSVFGQMVVDIKITGVISGKVCGAAAAVTDQDRRAIKWKMLQTWVVGLEDLMLCGPDLKGVRVDAARLTFPAREAAYRRLFQRGVSNESMLDSVIGRWVYMRKDEVMIETWNSVENDEDERWCKMIYCIVDA